MGDLREDAFQIIQDAINAVMPDKAVEKALTDHMDMIEAVKGQIHLIAIGKAAFTMAEKAHALLGEKIASGLVITKYDHLKEGLNHFEKIEAGHPIPDSNSVYGGQRAVDRVKDLSADDLLIFLISGGGSSVFEMPLEGLSIQDITVVTDQLLACGASISEINIVRKHMSNVKGGRFAQHCGQTPILAIALSDVIGNSFDTIASGPVHSDRSTSEMALDIIGKYNIFTGSQVHEALQLETPKNIENVTSCLAGCVKDLCAHAAESAQALGYKPLVLTHSLDCEAKEAGRFLASIARDVNTKESDFYPKGPCAIIAGGETVVTVSGKGKGGRSQELALSAAIGIEGLENVTIFSAASDGTDGPTDAAGGIVDGQSAAIMREEGVDPVEYLANNDAYRALYASGDLIITGPTGTNVNDLMVVLCD